MNLGTRIMSLRIADWVRSRLGDSLLMDRKERAARLAEEAIELAQAEGISLGEMERITDRVYSRPVGEPSQEVGGIGVCLLAWGIAAGQDPMALTMREVERIEQVPADVTRAKHAAKAAAGTALPPETR